MMKRISGYLAAAAAIAVVSVVSRPDPVTGWVQKAFFCQSTRCDTNPDTGGVLMMRWDTLGQNVQTQSAQGDGGFPQEIDNDFRLVGVTLLEMIYGSGVPVDPANPSSAFYNPVPYMRRDGHTTPIIYPGNPNRFVQDGEVKGPVVTFVVDAQQSAGTDCESLNVVEQDPSLTDPSVGYRIVIPKTTDANQTAPILVAAAAMNDWNDVQTARTASGGGAIGGLGTPSPETKGFLFAQPDMNPCDADFASQFPHAGDRRNGLPWEQFDNNTSEEPNITITGIDGLIRERLPFLGFDDYIVLLQGGNPVFNIDEADVDAGFALNPIDGINQIVYDDSSAIGDQLNLPSGVVMVVLPTVDRNGVNNTLYRTRGMAHGSIRDSDILITSKGLTLGGNFSGSMQGILVNALGHAIGLDHSPLYAAENEFLQPAMFPIRDEFPLAQPGLVRYLEADDEAAMLMMYPGNLLNDLSGAATGSPGSEQLEYNPGGGFSFQTRGVEPGDLVINDTTGQPFRVISVVSPTLLNLVYLDPLINDTITAGDSFRIQGHLRGSAVSSGISGVVTGIVEGQADGTVTGDAKLQVSGQADVGASTSTILEDSLATFATSSVGLGDLVVNLATGEVEVVQGATETQVAHTALAVAWVDGDGYAVIGNLALSLATGLSLSNITSDFAAQGVANGDLVLNLSDGSSALVSTVSPYFALLQGVGLSGGADNIFELNDQFRIIGDGVTAGASTTILWDADVDFTALGVVAGSTVTNITDGNRTCTVATVAQHQITCASALTGGGVFNAGDSYQITGSFKGQLQSNRIIDLGANFTAYPQLNAGDIAINITKGVTTTLTGVPPSPTQADTNMLFLADRWEGTNQYRLLDAGGALGTPSGTVLVDNSKEFKQAGVEKGDVVYNLTDGSWSTIEDVESDVSIRLDGLTGGADNTFAPGDRYEIVDGIVGGTAAIAGCVEDANGDPVYGLSVVAVEISGRNTDENSIFQPLSERDVVGTLTGAPVDPDGATGRYCRPSGTDYTGTALGGASGGNTLQNTAVDFEELGVTPGAAVMNLVSGEIDYAVTVTGDTITFNNALIDIDPGETYQILTFGDEMPSGKRGACHETSPAVVDPLDIDVDDPVGPVGPNRTTDVIADPTVVSTGGTGCYVLTGLPVNPQTGSAKYLVFSMDLDGSIGDVAQTVRAYLAKVSNRGYSKTAAFDSGDLFSGSPGGVFERVDTVGLGTPDTIELPCDGITGSATGGSTTTLVDANRDFSGLNLAAPDMIELVAADGTVSSVTTATLTVGPSNTITFTPALGTAFASGSYYRLARDRECPLDNPVISDSAKRPGVISVRAGQVSRAVNITLPAERQLANRFSDGTVYIGQNNRPSMTGTPSTLIQPAGSYSFTPVTVDQDGDPLVFSITNKPNWASFDTATGALTGTPTQADSGVTSGIVISVSDGNNSPVSLSPFSIRVNSPPSISGSPVLFIAKGGSYSFTPSVTDGDGDALIYSATNLPAWANFSSGPCGAGELCGTAQSGSYANVILIVQDPYWPAVSMAGFTITVNSQPTISGTPAATAGVGVAYSFIPTAVDGDALFSGTATGGSTTTLVDASADFDGPSLNIQPASKVEKIVGGGPVAEGFVLTAVNDTITLTAALTNGHSFAGGDSYRITDLTQADPLTFSVDNLPSWAGFNTITGELSGTPGAGDSGAFDDITISVTDGVYEPVSLAPFSITVNGPPSIGGTPQSRAYPGVLYTFTPDASDPEQDDLIFSVNSQLPSWALFDPATGEISGTPAQADANDYTGIVITVTDGINTAVVLPTFTIRVNSLPVPAFPAGYPDTSVLAGTAIGGYSSLVSATDAEGDTITWTFNRLPSWATGPGGFDSNSGTITNTAVTTPGSTVEIILSVQDNQGPETVSLPPFTILVNETPAISGTPAATVDAGSAYSFVPVANDPDGDFLSFTIQNKPSWAAFNALTGELSGTPVESNAGVYSNIIISVLDNNFPPVSLAAFSIKVNGSPVLSGTPAAMAYAGTAYTFTPVASDPNGDAVTFAITNKPDWAEFDASTGTLSGTPVADDGGAYAGIQITATDGSLTSLPITFTVTVNSPPAIEILAPALATVVPNAGAAAGDYTLTIRTTDVDGDAVTLSAADVPPWATLSGPTGVLPGVREFTLTNLVNRPAPADTGSYQIIFSADDGVNAPVSIAAFRIVVNTPPVFVVTYTTSVNAGSPYVVVGPPAATDADGDPLVYSITNKPVWATFNSTNGVLSGTPTVAQAGGYDGVTISVSDGNGAPVTTSFDIEVDGNPVISGTPPTVVSPGSLYTFTPTVSDPNGDTLTFQLAAPANRPPWATFSTTTGTITGTPAVADEGTSAALTIEVSDDGGVTWVSLAPFTITVNGAPVFDTPDDTIIIPPPAVLNFTLPVTNTPVTDVLTWSATGLPSFLSIEASAGNVFGSLTMADVGNYTFTVTVSDGVNPPVSTSMTLIVNSAPVLTNTSVTAPVNQVFSFTPEITDVNGDAVTITVTDCPEWAVCDPVTGAVSGTPTQADWDDSTTWDVDYDLDDGNGPPVSATVIITLNAPPVITTQPSAVYTLQPAVDSLTVVVDADDSPGDADGDTLVYSITGQPGWTQFDTATGGLISQTVTAAEIGTSTVTISVSDGINPPVAFTTFTIQVDGNPTISGTPATVVAPGQLYTFTPTVSDPNGDTLTFQLAVPANLPSWATFSTTTGTITGTPAVADEGTSAPLTIQVRDSVGPVTWVSLLPAFQITVNGVPVFNTPNPTFTYTPLDTVSEFFTVTNTPGTDTLTWSAAGLPSFLSIDASTGEVTGPVTLAEVGNYTFTVTVSDGLNAPVTTGATLIVSGAPVMTSAISVTVPVNKPFTYTPVFTDPNGDTVTITDFIQCPYWAVCDYATGTVTGFPTYFDWEEAFANGDFVIEYELFDGTATSYPTVTLDLNAPPFFDLAGFNSNYPDGVLWIDLFDNDAVDLGLYLNDPDGDTLSYSATNLPHFATLLSNFGAIFVDTNLPGVDVGNYTGIVATVTDGVNDSISFPTITIKVNGTPGLSVFAVTAPVGKPFTYTPVITDPNGDDFSFDIWTCPDWATCDPITGAVTGTPTLHDWETADQFGNWFVEYEFYDGVDFNTELLDIFLNAPPVFDTAGFLSTYPDATLVIDIGDTFNIDVDDYISDADGDSLTWTVQNLPFFATFDGELDDNFGLSTEAGNHSNIQITFSDGINDPVEVPAITIKVNGAPVMTNFSATLTALAGEDFIFTPVTSDVNDDTVSVAFGALNECPSWAVCNPVTGAVFGTPSVADDAGEPWTLVYELDDGTALSIYSIDIDLNVPPAITTQPNPSYVVLPPGGTVSVLPAATDADGDTLIWFIVDQPPFTQFDASTGALTSAAVGTGNNGSYPNIRIFVTDGIHVPVGSEFFSIIVNSTPVLSGSPASLASAGVSYAFTPEVDDDEDDTHTFTILNKPDWLVFNPSTGKLSGTPVSSDSGNYPGIQITVTDQYGASSSMTFSITVNTPPVIATALPPEMVVLPGVPFTFTVEATDVDEDALAFTIDSLPPWTGVVPTFTESVIVAGTERATFSGTANASGADNGSYNVVISVSDGVSPIVYLAPIRLVVNNPPVFVQPYATATQVNTAYSSPAALPVATDADGDALTYSAEGLPLGLQINPATGVISGTPEVAGNYDITVTVTDENVSTVQYSYTLNVNGLPEFESGGTGTLIEYIRPGESVNIEYSFSDPNNDLLTVGGVNLPLWLTVVTEYDDQLAAHYFLRGSPAPADVGTYAGVGMQVSDDGGTTWVDSPLVTLVVNVAPSLNTPFVNEILIPETNGFTVLYPANQGTDPDAGDLLYYRQFDADSILYPSVLNWASIDEQTGALSGDPIGWSGIYRTGVCVSDHRKLSLVDGFYQEVCTNAFFVHVVSLPNLTNSPDTFARATEVYSFTPEITGGYEDTRTFAIINKPRWAVFDTATGTLSGVPISEDKGVYPGIQISVNDSVTGTTNFAPFSITVNSRPTISGTPQLIAPVGQPYSFIPTAIDLDESDYPLTFVIQHQPSWAAFDTGTGELSGTPVLADRGSYANVLIGVDDGFETTYLEPFTLLVSSPPTIGGLASSYIVPTNVPITAITPTSSDPDGDTLQFSLTVDSSPAGSHVWWSFDVTNGTLSGTPLVDVDHNDVGEYTFTVKATDGTFFRSLTYTLKVNADPTITNLYLMVPVNKPLTYVPQIVDPNGDTVTIVDIDNCPDWAVCSETDGSITGFPSLADWDNNSYYTIDYELDDGAGSTFHTVDIELNAPPFIDTYTFNQDSVQEVDVGNGFYFDFTNYVIEADGPDYYCTIENQPLWSQFDTSSCDLYDSFGAFGEDSTNILVTVHDGFNDPVTLPPLTIRINEWPTLTLPGYVIAQAGVPFELIPEVDDPDANETFSYDFFGTCPEWAFCDTTTGRISGTPTANSFDVYSVDVEVYDHNGLSDFETVDIDVNSPPILETLSPNLAVVGQQYTFELSVLDFDTDDGDVVSINEEQVPPFFGIPVVTGSSPDPEVYSYTFTPTALDAGTYVLIFSADDGVNPLVFLEPFTLYVNTPPVISHAYDNVVDAGAAYISPNVGVPVAVDADGDPLTYSIENKPSWATFSTLTGRLTGNPVTADVGIYEDIVVTATDTNGIAVSTAPFSITVDGLPTIAGTPDTFVLVDQPYSFTPTADDPSDDALTFTIAPPAPSWAIFNPFTGQLSGTPTQADSGTTYGPFDICVDDDIIAPPNPVACLDPFSITVNGQPFFLNPPSNGAVNPGIPYTFDPSPLLVADDPDGDTLAYTLTGRPAWLTFDNSNGTFTGTPTLAEVGNYTMTLTVTDFLTPPITTAPFTVRVNGAPTITNTPGPVLPGVAFTFTPTITDANGDTVTITAVNNCPSWAVCNLTTGTISGTASLADSVPGTWAVSYDLDDGTSTPNIPKPLTMNVPPVNVTANPGTIYVNTGNSLNFVPTATDTDTLVWSITGQPQWTTFDTATGVLDSAATNPGMVGTYSGITISVSDGVNAPVAIGPFTIIVNGAPVLSAGTPVRAVPGTAFTFTVPATDPNSDPLTFNYNGTCPIWALCNTSTGVISGTPSSFNSGTYLVNVSVQDPGGLPVVPVIQGYTIVVNTPPAFTVPASDWDIPDFIGTQTFHPANNATDVDAPADTVTYSVQNLPAWAGFNPTTGAIQGDPATALEPGLYDNIIVTATDGYQTTAQNAFSIYINAQPTISGTPAERAFPNELYSFTPVATDTDGDSLLFNFAGTLPPWALFDSATGEISGTPTQLDSGIYGPFTIEVTDTIYTEDIGLFFIDVNALPVIVSGPPPTEVNIGGSYSYTPQIVDFDDTVHLWELVNAPTVPSAWLSVNPLTGALTGTAPGSGISYHFQTLRVSDDGGTNWVSFPEFTLIVNAPPTITLPAPSPIVVNVGSPLSLVPGGGDPNGDTVLYSITGKPSWAVFDQVTGTLSSTGNLTAAEIGTYSGIVISVTDNIFPAVSTSPFAVKVNGAPSISAGTPPRAVPDTAFTFAIAGTDPNSDVLAFDFLGSCPTWAFCSTTTGTISGTPATGDVGVWPVTVQARDAANPVPLVSNVLNLSITVNSAPVFTAAGLTPALSVNAGNPYTYPSSLPTATDGDGDTPVYSITGKPSWALFNPTTGALTGNPVVSNAGVYSNIVISVTDGFETTALPPFSITVTAAPNISGTPGTAAVPGVLYSFTPTASSPTGNPISFLIVNKPSWASFNTSTGRLSGTPVAADAVRSYTNIGITVRDNVTLLTASLPVFQITVNSPPVVSGSPALAAAVSSAYSFVPTASDPNGDSLTWSIENRPPWATFSGGDYPTFAAGTGTLGGTPVALDKGSYVDLRIWVSDGINAPVALDPFAIIVNSIPVPSFVTAIPGDSTFRHPVNPLTAFAVNVTASDADVPAEILTWSVQNLPAWAQFNQTTGALTNKPGRPVAADGGTYSNIIISVTDGNFAPVALAPFSVVVNLPPTISGTSVSTIPLNFAYTFAPTASDPESDLLTYSISGNPLWMNIDPLTGAVSGSPTLNPGDVGTTAGIVVSVSDGLNATVDLTAFSITVNGPPDFVGSSCTDTVMTAGNPFYCDPGGTDPETDTLFYTITGKPDWATFNQLTGELSGTPPIATDAVYSNIVISAKDQLNTAVDHPPFTITVVRPNLPPVFDPATPATVANPSVLYTFTPVATDIDNDTLVYSIANKPPWALFNTATGQLYGTPIRADAKKPTPYTNIVISVDDGVNPAVSLPAFDINVNNPPTIAGTPATLIQSDVAFSFTPIADDVDDQPTPDTLTFSVVNLPYWAAFNSANGNISGTPASNDAEGSYVGIQISVDDGVNPPVALPAFDLIVNAQPTIDFDTVLGTVRTEYTVAQTGGFSQLGDIRYTVSDIDPLDTLNFVIENQPAWIDFDPATGLLAAAPGHPDTDDIGTYTFRIGVTDGNFDPVYQTEVIVVANGAPVLTGTPNPAYTAGIAFAFGPVIANAEAGDNIDVASTGAALPAWATLDPDTGLISGLPPATESTTYPGIILTVTDNINDPVDFGPFDIVINRPPVVTNTPSGQATAGQIYTFTPNVTDFEGDTLSYQLVNAPAWMDFNTTSGVITGNPSSTDVGAYINIIWAVSDGTTTVYIPFNVIVSAAGSTGGGITGGNVNKSSGGGCSAGSADPAAAIWLAMLASSAVVRLRRRRRS